MVVLGIFMDGFFFCFTFALPVDSVVPFRDYRP